MAVDAVTQTLYVKPAKDSHDKPRRDQRQEGQAAEREPEGREEPARPQRNAYGQLIGEKINITA